MSKKRPNEAGAARGGPHHALRLRLRLRPDQCMLCRQVGHRASECPNKRKATAFSPGQRALGTYVLGCAVFDSPVFWCNYRRNRTRSETRRTSKTLLRFQMRVWRSSPFLTEGATKTVSGFMSVQRVADPYEGTTIEMTDVGFTFAGGETEAASTKICIPHAEFPQGISVNVVSIESTPFLNGLDVLREYGLVIDYHCNRVYSHILKR